MEMVGFTFLSWEPLKLPAGFRFLSYYLLCMQAIRASLAAN